MTTIDGEVFPDRDDLDAVERLRPEVTPCAPEAVADHRAGLLAAIDGERAAARLPAAGIGAVKWLARAAAVALGLAVVGGGTALAWRVVAPDPHQAETLDRRSDDERKIHSSGWRPELRAEDVQCDYRAMGAAAPHGDPGMTGYVANGFPIEAPLTFEEMVAACAKGPAPSTGAEMGPVGDDVPRVLCEWDGQPYPVPIVAFGTPTCSAPEYGPASPDLLERLNRMRRTEVAIKATPQDCPTRAETLAWVKAKIAESGEPLEVVDDPRGVGCFRPFVSWDVAEVTISGRVASTIPPVLPPWAAWPHGRPQAGGS